MLAMLGWNDGTEQEIFTLEELCEKFSLDRVHKSGAKFDYEKAKWFNHEWIKKLEVDSWQMTVKNDLKSRGIEINDEAKFTRVLELIKDRCTLLTDFYDQLKFFFVAPGTVDVDSIKGKWNDEKTSFFKEWISSFDAAEWKAPSLESSFKELAASKNIKVGELMLPLRIMLVGGKFGPGVFDIAELIGKEETKNRIEKAISLL
jgi:glutamyl-tRNA synthetase